MCGRLVNLDTVARVLADYYHLKTGTQLAALDEALSKVPAVSVGGGHKKDHIADPGKMVGDSISRQAAIDTCMKYNGYGSVWACIMGDIKQLPSAQPERKKGKWEMNPDPYGFFEEIPVCSECGCTTKMREMYNYCPNCGADMRGR